ncbi:MAG: ribosome silencing factor [Peptostreptococcaceae bacterium]|nr:ribosome silencing factor [Peptostreptococcaceae bacterium]
MKELLNGLYKELDDKQAEDILLIDVKSITSITDYFVIASADNIRKVRSIADHIESFLEKNGLTLRAKEGTDSAKWILLDFGNLIIHLFENEERDYYNLEKIWKDGINITPNK